MTAAMHTLEYFGSTAGAGGAAHFTGNGRFHVATSGNWSPIKSSNSPAAHKTRKRFTIEAVHENAQRPTTFFVTV
jgi:hypothetical protein